MKKKRKYILFLVVGCFLITLHLTAFSASIETFHKSTFDPYVHDKFLVTFGSGKVEMELVELKGEKSQKMEYFSLLFLGPNQISLKQSTYEIWHSQLGTFSLFLVPIGKDAKGLYYEAVFTRILK